jgi:hypothetical protein
MKLNPHALGLSLGIIWVGALFLTTWLSLLTGYGKTFLDVLAGSIYPGYTISPFGSIWPAVRFPRPVYHGNSCRLAL